MKISLGCDHGGLELKNKIKDHLLSLGHEVLDCGTYSSESCDYPLFAIKAAEAVVNKEDVENGDKKLEDIFFEITEGKVE